MLDRLTIEDFLPRKGARFRLQRDDSAPLELELVSVTSLAAGAGAPRRAPFSLTFRGPSEPLLPQRIYGLDPIEADPLGRLEIFLVPVGPDGSGMTYEAIFN